MPQHDMVIVAPIGVPKELLLRANQDINDALLGPAWVAVIQRPGAKVD
jgi:hypothetical protein